MLSGSSIYIELLFLVLLSHSSSDVHGITETTGYATSSQSSETEETEATDYSDDIIFSVMNISYNDMTANGTSLPYLPTTTTTTDEPNSTTWESATIVLQNTTDHSNDSTVAIETTETAATMGVTTKELEITTVTAATTVVPIPNVHKFSLKNGSSYCFLFQSDIKFQIFYHSQNKLVKSYEFTVSNATINDNESVCSEHYTKLSLTFIPYGQNEEHKWTLVLLFNLMEPNKTSNDATTVRSTYTLNSLILNYYMDKTLFPDSLTPGQYANVSSNNMVFRIPVGSYYSCLIVPEITLTGNEKILNSCKLFMKNLKVEAFMNNSVEAFIGNETLCDSDVNVNNMVPIGVGIALIVCIVVAITVFIVFSKRNRRSYTTL
ncbi:Lysosome-associated membrane glycoprotein 1, variant 2 [Schistosoma haematobium]|uniref:Lysosome-associated membrane glycoprotein 1, variant 2 n=1 Tax=Schistosoma haematobium TaxID=6185 RepID=A0A922S3Y0_SCHHA|nr:Lysosome-associated membrane glycoprotein 1, variant 2 [Schistosoma haematobium]KAH9592354.1 Lysosome-associated membrane glycoprotein 1, variant 2 [Schistosoma haematobium]CAH8676993.1 unnamed protein product [Schistosoma haematobium]